MLMIFRIGFLFLGWLFLAFSGKEMQTFAQNQDFENPITVVSYPEEFLPGWWGNEVRSTSSRVFQLSGQGRNGSRALAVQPISTFDGVIWVKLNQEIGSNKRVSFWAKSLRNGSGSRTAEVQISWSASLDGDYIDVESVGTENTFPNATTEFQKFNFSPPPSLTNLPEIFLKIEVRYGAGSGSAARWVMDDFYFGESEDDLTPPQISSVKGYDSQEILVQFDEAVDPVFSRISLAYLLEGENPVEVQPITDSSLVLKFERQLVEGSTYPLSVSQIPDLEGNFLKDTVVRFTFYDPTDFQYKSLVINEIMPAPRAEQDLPNVEYIELFNPMEKELRLDGLLLSNSRNETMLTDYWILPQSYLILCPSGSGSQFESFGEVLEVRSWPTLLNSGDVISLRTENNVLVDQLSFQTSTWGGSEFAQGGYSLEVPNPEFQCANSGLLLTSTDPLRGTPGKENSVFNEESTVGELNLEQLFFKDSTELVLRFTQPLPPSFGLEQLNFSPNLTIDSLYQISENQWNATLKTPVTYSQVYELTLVNVSDCYGNFWESIGPWELVLAKKAQSGDLELNEILFNPRTGDPKFVEVANVTSDFIDLAGWSLSNGNQVRIFGVEGLILPPNGYLAVTTDSAALRRAYPKSADGKLLEFTSIPSYPISGGTVILQDAKGVSVDSFAYSEDLHHPIIRDPKGVSLERIRIGTAQSISTTWMSAAASQDYATPGKENSQVFSGEIQASWLQIEPKVFDPEGTQGPSFTTFRYELPNPGWVGTLRIFNSMGALITTLAQNQILGAEGVFTWTGTLASGGRMAPGYYVVLFELFDLDGRSHVIKETVVVASRL